MAEDESTVRRERVLDDGSRAICVVRRTDGTELRYVVGRKAQRGALVGDAPTTPSLPPSH